MNDQDLHIVNSHKHLGVIISDNGQWNDHIDYIVKKKPDIKYRYTTGNN